MEEERRGEEGEEEEGEGDGEREEGEEGEEGEEEELDTETSKSTQKSRTKSTSSAVARSKHTGIYDTYIVLQFCALQTVIDICAGYQYGHIPWADADVTVLVDERGVPKFCLQELSTKVYTCTWT